MGEYRQELDAFGGSFREDFRFGRRITSAEEGLIIEVAAQGAPGGDRVIRDGLEAEKERTPASGAAQVSVVEAAPTRIEDAAHLTRAEAEMHLLIDLPPNWPGWSLARRIVKRTLDVLVSVMALCALLPVFVGIALAIRLESSGPVLYRQRRCGRDGRTFEMLKFRSMVPGADRMLIDLRDRNEADGLLFKIKHDPRITRVGEFIRRYSVDELPQFINVLKGEMSLVGPRPLPKDANAFGPIDGKRHAVRPGLTCHWQVSGRSDVSYGQMVDMDLRYIRDSSIWTDLRLIALTIPAALAGDGAY